MATVSTLHSFNHATRVSKSSVKAPKAFTGSDKSGFTATKCSLLEMSIPAALGEIMGNAFFYVMLLKFKV